MGVNMVVIYNMAKVQVIISHLMTILCPWCGGRGHSEKSCATSQNVSTDAREADCTWDMGCIKGACWDPAPNGEAVRQLERLQRQVSLIGKRNRYK